MHTNVLYALRNCFYALVKEIVCNPAEKMKSTSDFLCVFRGDIAFCSLECRQQQMNYDDRKEKCSMESIKKEASSSVVAASESSTNGESIAAA